MTTINKNQIIKGSLEHRWLFWEGIVQTGTVGMEVTSISSDNKMTHRRLQSLDSLPQEADQGLGFCGLPALMGTSPSILS